MIKFYRINLHFTRNITNLNDCYSNTSRIAYMDLISSHIINPRFLGTRILGLMNVFLRNTRFKRKKIKRFFLLNLIIKTTF